MCHIPNITYSDGVMLHFCVECGRIFGFDRKAVAKAIQEIENEDKNESEEDSDDEDDEQDEDDD